MREAVHFALVSASLAFVGVVPLHAQAPAPVVRTAMASDTLAQPVDTAARAARAENNGFRARQLRETRVAAARRNAESELRALYAERGVDYPSRVLFRVFKKERIFEVWALDARTDRYVLLRNLPVCAVSGHLGPKRQRGDYQVPEGFYSIDLFNPRSQYHLSLRVDYPNAVDRQLGRLGRLGGDIYVHGGCATVGCVPVTDEVMDQLYWLAVEARSHGQQRIPIHIYPSRMEGAPMAELAELAGGDYSTWRFWLSLKAGYDHFRQHQQLPRVGVHENGYYLIGG